jgi:hypothetical protein
MKSQTKPLPLLKTPVFVLKHLESGEYVSLKHGEQYYLAAFTDGDSATTFRADLGQVEHATVVSLRLADIPADYFWLDGEMLHRMTFA